jgi:Family of unknown function (DUF6494)
VNNETFNMSIRKFLKNVGVRSQLAVEQAVNGALQTGAIAGKETFPARMTLEVEGLQLHVVFDGTIELE